VISCFSPNSRVGLSPAHSTVAVMRIQRSPPLGVTMAVSRLKPLPSAMARLRIVLSVFSDAAG